MAATETRLLVLGAVSLFEPVNGYQIRRELVSWEIEEWAHIKPGSIYSSLSTLTSQGHLARHDLVDGGRDVAVYTATDAGRLELHRLFKVALETVFLLSPLAFHTGLMLLPLLTREEFAGHVRARIAAIEEAQHDGERRIGEAEPAALMPPHLLPVIDLWGRMETVELTWLRELLAMVEGGAALDFQGEAISWSAPADDPGWQMDADRKRYRTLLGL